MTPVNIISNEGPLPTKKNIEAPGNSSSPQKGFWRAKFREFGETVAITGARYISSPSEPLGRKILWTILALGGLVCVGLQMQIQIVQYISRPTAVDIRENFVTKLPFPTITLCPESRFYTQRVAAQHPDMESMLNDVYPPYQDFNAPPPNITAYNMTSMSSNWTETYINMSVNSTESVFQCIFKGSEMCMGPGNFHHIFTQMGYCFSFNLEGTRTQDGGGMLSGLILLLQTDQNNHIALNDYTSGFRALIHNKDDFPNMQRGLKLDVGKVTLVKMSKRKMSLLPAPYGDCSSRTLEYFTTYTKENCQTECLAKVFHVECGCSAVGMPGNGAFPICNPIQETRCVFPILLMKDQIPCDCPTGCSFTSYNEVLSTSSVADFFVNYVSKNLSHGTVTPAEIRGDFATVIFYFPSLSFTEVATKRSYSLVDMLCDMGGALGLLLGSTFFTVYEFFDFFIWAGWEKAQLNKKIHP